MKAVTALCLSLFLFILGATRAGATPSLVYSTSLEGEGLDVAVDSAGNAIVLGYRASTDSYFLAKLSPMGELIFLRPLEFPLIPSLHWRTPSTVALDSAGYIYVAGTTLFDDCEDIHICWESIKTVAFVAKLGPDGTGVVYHATYSEGSGNTQAHDLAVDALGRAHVQYSGRRDRYAIDDSAVATFSPAGSLAGGFGYYNMMWSYTTAMALGPSGDFFTVGWRWSVAYVDPEDTYLAAYVLRMDASSGALAETVFDYNEGIQPLDIAGAPGGGSVVVGRKGGDFYIAGFGPEGEEVFSRLLNLGAAEIRDVAVTSSGEIILAGYTKSGSGFPSGAFVQWLDGGTGEVLSSINLGSSGHLFAASVALGPGGDAYVTGGGFIARISENRSPDCSRSTASPSVISPPNGKMIPVSILGVTDPEGDAVALKVTGISQDEPGTAFSGIGSSVAQVKAERAGKGDGRVYRIDFQATDPIGTSCTGQVTVCVPHDQGQGSCVDSGALVSSSR